MEYCKTCALYDSEYDELRRSGDDVIVIGQENTERHYCRMYDTNIPPEVVENKKRCEFHIE